MLVFNHTRMGDIYCVLGSTMPCFKLWRDANSKLVRQVKFKYYNQPKMCRMCNEFNIIFGLTKEIICSNVGVSRLLPLPLVSEVGENLSQTICG